MYKKKIIETKFYLNELVSMKKATLVFLFNSKGQILLNMKKRGFGEGKWNGAGGKPNEGETMIQCALRELEEETTISLHENDLLEKGYIDFHWDGNPEWDCRVFVFVGNSDLNGSETEEMKPKWFYLKDIPYDSMWEDDSIWLPELLNGENVKYVFNFGMDGKIRDYRKI